MDIRLKTVLVIEKDGQYLSRKMLGAVYEWDPHLSCAVKTRDREKAAALAEKYGGRLALFNPVIWRVKVL